MPTLLGWISTGKGSWAEMNQLVLGSSWDKVILLTGTFGKENFSPAANTELLEVDVNLETSALVQVIKKVLTGKISGFEVALNFCSGSGKEHMALLEAVIELGFNFRLVTVKNNRMVILGLEN